MPAPEISVDTASVPDRDAPEPSDTLPDRALQSGSGALPDRALSVDSETQRKGEMSFHSDAADRHVEERRFSAALTIKRIAGFSPRIRCAKEG
jgi:hypothetical protein